MQYHWLKKTNDNKLFLFFTGWSFDANSFEFLTAKNADVLVIYDYNEISSVILTELLPQFNQYTEINLISWSMGVFVAEQLKNFLPKNINRKIAINGTLLPIHDEYGIPQKTFDLTLKFVESGLKGKFYQNIFHKPEEYDRYLQTPVQRTLKNRAEELENLNRYITNNKIDTFPTDKFYDLAIISNYDKIIPTKNQINFWQKLGCDIMSFETGHFPFYQFNNWNEILDANKSPNN